MDKIQLAQYLDLANHKQNATPQEIKILCENVKKFGFHTAFVNPCYVPMVKDILFETKIAVGTVISFPLGQDTQDVKTVAAIQAVRAGADELDVCMNVGWFKEKMYKEVQQEMNAVVDAAKGVRDKTIVKIIIETGWLGADEIRKASQMVIDSGADFVKTCSGMGPRGAKIEDVCIIGGVGGDKCKIKVAGGIETLAQALEFIEAGASRIGTSHAVDIISQMK
jgi:deoxyribose-phosphate aldolase